MKIPIFVKQKFVDSDGELFPPIQQAFDVFFQQAQENLSDDGFVVPQLSTNQINNISNSSNSNHKPDGTLWYDSQTNELKVRINGTVRVIQTT